ncbi:MAG: hypothetical protein HQK76_07300 [Desulfobacterales bacterium]|nr:hypothetical protein [Desulfobacterales bacterium]
MSAIFGMLYLDDRPIKPEDFQAMLQAINNWGPDGTNVYLNGYAGLGHCLLCTTPESHHEKMPIVNSESGIIITAAARLDNRDKLCELFQIPQADRPSFPDGRIVNLVFERFREDSPKYLFGDWSFAAWDKKNRKLFVARDHMGCTSLFYYYKPPLFAFASTQKALFALPEVSYKIDEWQLARYLAIFIEDQEESRTFWHDIKLLRPSHCLTITPETINLKKYWGLNDIPSFRLKSDDDYLEGFLEQFRRAVRVRLRSDGIVATTLSCGLDSGTVTALAAEALQEKGIKLPAFTSVPLYPADHLVPGAITNEWELANSVAKKYRNIDHIPVRSETVSPLKSVHDMFSIIGSPIHAAVNAFWLFDIHRQAKELGAGVLITGQLGNGGVSWSGGSNRILFLFMNGYWKKGLQALRQYKIKHGYSWRQAIKRHILAPVLGPVWKKRSKVLHPFDPVWGQYSAINPKFADHLGLKKAMKAAKHEPFFAKPKQPLWERHRILEINSPLGYIHHFIGSAFSLDVRDPTADIELLNFCMGVPEELHNFDGGERMFIKRAMNGILPDEVCWNRIRGKQAADVALRILDYGQEMESELQMLETDKTVGDYIDCKAMRKAWQDLQNNLNPKTANNTASLLLRGSMAGRFVKKL